MIRSLALFLVAGVLTLAPLSASAANVNFFGPIIPDGTNGQPDCNCEAVVGPDGKTYQSAPDWGCVLQTVQNAIAVGISFVVIIITLSIAYAGIMIMANPNNPGQREQGRSLVMNAIIGLVIVLTAWLIVDFVMKAFYNPSAAAPYTEGNALPWNAIISDDSGGSYCFVPTATPEPTASGDGGGALNPVPSGTGGSTAPPASTGPASPSTPTPEDPATTVAPPAPTSFNISLTGTTATVLWAKASSGVTTYTIERGIDGGSWAQIATVKLADAGSYTDANLSLGTRYYYRMFAWNGTKPSPSTQVLDVTTNGGQAPTATVPPNPTSLSATPVGTSQVNLSWSPVSGASGYQLDLATTSAGGSAPSSNSAWKKIQSTSGTSYSYSIPPASQANTSLFFRLWAMSGSTYSKTPASASVTLRSGSSTGGSTVAHSCTTGTAGSGPDAGKVKSSLSCVNCVTFQPECKPGTGCKLTSASATKINSLWNSQTFSGTWRVTEGFPPSLCEHNNSCHYTGTCVDTGFTGQTTYTASNVKSYIDAANALGLRAVFETKSCDLRDAVRELGVPTTQAYCGEPGDPRTDKAYGHITADHFSVYLY